MYLYNARTRIAQAAKTEKMGAGMVRFTKVYQRSDIGAKEYWETGAIAIDGEGGGLMRREALHQPSLWKLNGFEMIITLQTMTEN